MLTWEIMPNFFLDLIDIATELQLLPLKGSFRQLKKHVTKFKEKIIIC